MDQEEFQIALTALAPLLISLFLTAFFMILAGLAGVTSKPHSVETHTYLSTKHSFDFRLEEEDGSEDESVDQEEFSDASHSQEEETTGEDTITEEENVMEAERSSPWTARGSLWFEERAAADVISMQQKEENTQMFKLKKDVAKGKSLWITEPPAVTKFDTQKEKKPRADDSANLTLGMKNLSLGRAEEHGPRRKEATLGGGNREIKEDKKASAV